MCNFTIEKLKEEKQRLEEEVYGSVELEIADCCRKFVVHAQEYAFCTSKEKGKQKHEQLSCVKGNNKPDSVHNIVKSRWVANHSKHELTTSERSVLGI